MCSPRCRKAADYKEGARVQNNVIPSTQQQHYHRRGYQPWKNLGTASRPDILCQIRPFLKTMAVLEHWDDQDPLCCCEYQNSHGQRAHLLGLFCDCAELDDAFDKLISRVKIPSNRTSAILQVVEDRLRLPWAGGALKLPVDKISPWILVPFLFQLASYSWKTQLLVHGGLLPLVIFCKYKTCLKSYRPETKFFVSWSLATFGYLFYVYQIHIIGIFNLPKTISPLENLVLIGM